jgi:hypothetical protein
VPVVRTELHRSELLVADDDAFGIAGTVELGSDLEPGSGLGPGDEVDDDLVARQGVTAPVRGDVTEQPVLDLG